MVGEEKRHQMMQNLFGDQSEEEEEEEVESEHESNRQPGNASEEDGGVEPEVEGEAEVEGHSEAEIESDVEVQDASQDHVESDGERDQSSQEVDTGDHREESGEKSTESDEKTLYAQRAATSRRRDTVNSASERSEDNHYTDQDEEVNQTGNNRSPSLEKDEANFPDSAPEIRDVFGSSDEDEPVEHENQIEDDSNRSPREEEDFDKELKPEDMIADEEGHDEFEEEHVDPRIKEKPTGPPLELEIPLRPPPAHPAKMNMIKVSNIMGIDQKPFDPKTYVEEDQFVTDDSGTRQRIRLENNIVRWRRVTKPDGTKTIESNARFVRWSDGSLQLLLGNEVLDISVQDLQHDQAHLFLRHKKGILQSQGRILKKMRFMPSSLSSNSHRLLTALVDSRHKKVNRVKNCITDIDPEREKEQKERIASQTIKANELLNKKKEKVNRKYSSQRKGRQLSPGFIDDEDDGYHDSRSSRRYDEDLERPERIMNAKKGNTSFFRKPSKDAPKSSRQRMDHSESDREESEYETEGEEDEGSPARGTEDVEEDYEEEEEEAEADEESEEEAEEPRRKTKEPGSSLKRKAIESDDEDSPPRKAAPQRRMAMVYSDDEE